MRRYKDLWFAEYERILNEEDVSYDQAAQMANEAAAERVAAALDAIEEEKWTRTPSTTR